MHTYAYLYACCMHACLYASFVVRYCCLPIRLSDIDGTHGHMSSVEVTYAEVRSDRLSLAIVDLLQTESGSHVVVCGFVTHSPAHVDHLYTDHTRPHTQ